MSISFTLRKPHLFQESKTNERERANARNPSDLNSIDQEEENDKKINHNFFNFFKVNDIDTSKVSY